MKTHSNPVGACVFLFSSAVVSDMALDQVTHDVTAITNADIS